MNFHPAAPAGLDIAPLAGIDSAEAVLSGDQTSFDRHFNPSETGIRRERKAFEFKVPVGMN